jgi:Xaa-Pro aminopeptidase
MQPDFTARKAPGMVLRAKEAQPDMARMRAYRLGRVQEKLRDRDLGGALLFDSINIRYTTGSSNGQIFNFHTPGRCLFVPPEGQAVLFDDEHLPTNIDGLGTIAEFRNMPAFCFFIAGTRVDEKAKELADQIDDLMRTHAGDNRRLAVDKVEIAGIHALHAKGLELSNAQEPLELARSIKSSDEIACILHVISVAETGIARMRAELEPGMTENELFSILHQTNIAMGGDWIDYRLLASGGRTNPWGQECSDKLIRAGELVAFDTGLIGPYGYGADMSRTIICHPAIPTDEQRLLYNLAIENIEYNLALIKPGVGFREIGEKGWKIPDEYVKNRYPTPVHGMGMGDEWPMMRFPQDFEASGFDGVIEENMTLSVESYIGADGGMEGVKLEEQILVTADGYQRLSTFPWEAELLG